MRLLIEIAAATLLVFCIATSGAASRRRQDRPQRRRIELLVQRAGKRISRGEMRRDQAAVRRKILRQLLRRQDAVGDVRAGGIFRC